MSKWLPACSSSHYMVGSLAGMAWVSRPSADLHLMAESRGARTAGKRFYGHVVLSGLAYSLFY